MLWGQETNISPVDIVDYIIYRVKTDPIVLCIIIEMRYAEVMFMFHDCKKTSRPNLFLAAMTFLAP